jgi:hypothetical protein
MLGCASREQKARKIMNQKLITAMSTVVAATACVVGCVLIWRLLVQTQQNHQTLLDQLSSMNQAREDANSGLMAALDRKGPDWQPLSVRLIDEEGEPVDDGVSLRGATVSGGEISEYVETDDRGVADFGLLPPGEYEAHYFIEDFNVGSSTEFLLGPGHPNEFEVICPSQPPAAFTLAFDIQPPEPLADIPLYYLAPLDYESRMFDGRSWRVGGGRQPVLVLNAAGDILGQAAYDDLTTRERDGITTSVSFVRELPADFELQPAEDLRAYTFDVELWAYVADPTAGSQGDERPHLNRLLGAALRNLPDQKPAPGGLHTVQVTADNAEFWDEVVDDLSRIDKYEGLFADATEAMDAPASD